MQRTLREERQVVGRLSEVVDSPQTVVRHPVALLVCEATGYLYCSDCLLIQLSDYDEYQSVV